MRRRDALRGLAAGLFGFGLPAVGFAATERRALRIGLTPVFLDDQAAFLNRWRDYLTEKSGFAVSFMQRASYREISEQVHAGMLDLAWMCGYPYVTDSDRLSLLAVPLHLGRPEYRSYLIAANDALHVQAIDDLAGGVFAFSDPNSFSGSLYPRYLLHQMGQSPDRFFRRSFHTWSHRKVVEAVAVGLADGGAVAGYVWETLAKIHPEITLRTRVVSRSPVFGFPPFVARAGLSSDMLDQLRRIFVDMRTDPEGARLLESLNLDGFIPGDPQLFEGIRQMARLVDHR